MPNMPNMKKPLVAFLFRGGIAPPTKRGAKRVNLRHDSCWQFDCSDHLLNTTARRVKQKTHHDQVEEPFRFQVLPQRRVERAGDDSSSMSSEESPSIKENCCGEAMPSSETKTLASAVQDKLILSDVVVVDSKKKRSFASAMANDKLVVEPSFGGRKGHALRLRALGGPPRVRN